MKSQKGKNIVIWILSIVIIILLVILVLTLTGTIKLKNKDNINNNDNTINDKVNDNNNVPNEPTIEKDWTEYILSCHILEAKIKRIRYKEFGTDEDQNETRTIELEQLKELLSELKNKKLIKMYSLGMGGSADGDYLEISYEKNDNAYTFYIRKNMITIDEKDKDIVKFFESMNCEVEHAEYKDEEGSFYVYKIKDYDESIYDKYFK